MTYEVQQTRWDRIIRRVSGSIGPGSRVSETISELFPMIDVERVPGELLLLGGTQLAIGASTITAAALEFAKIGVFNPAGSNTIITVTSVAFSVGATQIIRWSVTDSIFTTIVATQRARDTRVVLPSLPVGTIAQESSGGFVNANGQAPILGNSPLQLIDENGLAVLAPGTGFSVGATIAASQLFATFNWRERPAEESELNL